MDHAKCNTCSLRARLERDDSWIPVAGEKKDDERIIILGEAPGGHDVEHGRPFVGPSGSELQQALRRAGVERGVCQVNNVIACRPPGNNLELFLTQSRKSTLMTPQTACWDRVLHDIKSSSAKNILCLGKRAVQAVRGGAPSIMGIRGACEEISIAGETYKVAYTLHPSFVSKEPKWRRAFQHDIQKAVRFFDGSLGWESPQIVYPETEYEMMLALSAMAKDAEKWDAPIAYDLETELKGPMLSRLRCIGIASPGYAAIIPTRSISGMAIRRPEGMIRLLLEWFRDPPVPLVGHNAGQFDRLVMERVYGCTPKLAADTMLLHLIADNEMPHRLGVVGSIYTENPEAWKADHTATTAGSDTELWEYCAKDCAVTARIAKPLYREIKARKQESLIAREHALQEIGIRMQKVGMSIDIPRVKVATAQAQALIDSLRDDCLKMAKINPLSTTQLSALVFDKWDLPPIKYSTRTGLPATDDDTLRTLITKYDIGEDRSLFLQKVRFIRRLRKVLSTYLRPLLVAPPEGAAIKNLSFSPAIACVHPGFNRLPATGRYSSSPYNVQNIPDELPLLSFENDEEGNPIPFSIRSLFIPRKGNVYIGADYSALEARVVAEDAECERLLQGFREDRDIHIDNMEISYGPSIWSLDGAPKRDADGNPLGKGKGDFYAARGITKNVFYAWQYRAGAKRIWEQLISAENFDGSLPYKDRTVAQVRSLCKALEKGLPEIPEWWDRQWRIWEHEGYVADRMWDRRRYFLSGAKPNDVVNHPVQAKGASICHEAAFDLLGYDLPFETVRLSDEKERGRTLPEEDPRRGIGLIGQCHDSLLFEVPEEEVEEWQEAIFTGMERKVKGGLVDYTVELKVGRTWNEV